jgi:hypothetical protein
MLLALSAIDAVACSTDPPKVEPDRREVAQIADLVAIVRIDAIEPLTAAEEAELQRLLSDPPMDTPFRYPAPGLRFSTLRVLKGRMPNEALIQNGATSCDVLLVPGHDYVLFARLPAGEGARIEPLDGTFYLGKTERDQANLAEVQQSLTSLNQTTP